MKRSIGLSSFMNFYNVFLLNSFSIYLPIYFLGLKFSGYEIGILLSLFTFSALLSPVYGVLNDFLAPRALICLGILGSIGFLIGLKFVSSFWSFFGLFLVGGVGRTLFRLSIRSYLLKQVKERSEQSSKIGLFNASGGYAWGLGALIGGFFLASLEFQVVFNGVLFLFFLLFLLVWLLPAGEVKRIKSLHLSEIFASFKEQRFLILLIVAMMFSFHMGVEKTSFTPFLEGLGLSKDKMGLIFGIVGLVIGTGMIISGNYMDRISNPKAFFLVGLVISGLGNIGFAFVPGFYSGICARVLHAIGDAIVFNVIWISASQLFSIVEQGRMSGIVSLSQILGMGMGTVLAGVLADLANSFGFPFIVCGLLTLLCVPVLLKYF